MQFSLTSLLTLALALGASANTEFPDHQLNDSMDNNNGLDIAMAARPLWHFGKRNGKIPCYPSPAFIDGQQHGTEPQSWGEAQGDCAGPGIDAGSSEMSNPFPTYYTITRCTEHDLRVVYSVYYSHDGYAGSPHPAQGHTHDWEHVIVEWKRDNGLWKRNNLFLGYHGGHMKKSWASVQNTVNDVDLNEQGGTDKNIPKIYVGASKHANFDTRNTGWNDLWSQGCPREWRSQDWRYLPEESTLIPAGMNTDIGRQIDAAEWGKADGYPTAWEKADKVCNVQDGGYKVC